jgi:tRNA pseudouridine55 synthase
VARLRRASGERRIGHAGTLDPMASGVLLVAAGKATRLIEYLAETDKAYRADVTFGVETDTYDAEGKETARRDASHVTKEAVEAALPQFRGAVEQRPPAYSAISVGGRRLYDLARRGHQVEAPLRRVEITRLELQQWQPPVATLCVECSKGTYIRSLAHDLGQALGTGAHLSGLARTRVGRFRQEDATPLEALEEKLRVGQVGDVAHDPAEAVAHLPAVRLDEVATARLSHGIAVPAPAELAPGAGTLARAIGPDGKLIAIVRCAAVAGHGGEMVLRPEKVLLPRQ